MTAHTHHHRQELMSLDWNKAGKYKVQTGSWLGPGQGPGEGVDTGGGVLCKLEE